MGVVVWRLTRQHLPVYRELAPTMARYYFFSIVGTFVALLQFTEGTPRRGKQLVTCPGFPGYCSESYVGDTCTVVCSRGRNNVPQCQEDGTWTDVPRCIEHEPGIEEQLTGVCPGIPGYCSLDLPGALCEFACPIGAPIRSECTEDGTWEPYPTCEGDPRETQDGCDPCPGPNGAPRNRTLDSGARNSGSNRGGSNNRGGQRQNNGGRRQNNGGQRQNNGGQRQNNGGQRQNNNGGQRQNNGGQRKNNNGGSGRRPNSGGQRNNGGGSPKNNGGYNQNNIQFELPEITPVQAEFQEPRSFPTPSGKKQNNNQNQANNNRVESNGQCPGDELAACIVVCPGFTARVFGACVAGCAKRCPGRK